jgi:N-acetylglucosaminyldiphosphoundecaprenol N-acetyl-beta-D-mannosaminyltransferase
MSTRRGSADGREVLFGLRVDALDLDGAVERCRAAIDSGQRLLVGVVNAAKIVAIRENPTLRQSILMCDMVLADGQAVVWASRLLGGSLPERVTGIDLFEALLEVAERERRSIYLFGARPEVLEKVLEELASRHPDLVVAGHRDGYFAPEEVPAIAEDIMASGADMLFLGITSPIKENFLGEYADRLGVPVLHGVGGSFDILAGLTRRAPERWQRLGLEWAYRLVQEPRRLWKRYLRTNSRFLLIVARERLRPTPPYDTQGAQHG